MPDESATPDHASRLLQQAGSIRALAKSLLGDRDAATEAAHDVWLATGGSASHTNRPPSYLRTALRNRLRDRRRRSERERERGERASPAHHPATVDVAAGAEIRRRVLAAVEALHEPLRTTIWLRFFDDLPPRAIAGRLGVPVDTVRSRVRLGVEALRARLDELHDGDRRRWRSALATAAGLPLAHLTVAAPLLGVLTMKKLTLFACAAALAVVGGAVAVDAFDPGVAVPPSDAVTSASAARGAGADGEPPTTRRDEATGSPAAAAGPFEVRGRIELRMATDASLVEPGDGALTISDPDGDAPRRIDVRGGSFSFSVSRPAEVDLLELRLERWSIVAPHATWRCAEDADELVVPVEAFPLGRLLVVDAATSSHLTGVDVVRVVDEHSVTLEQQSSPGLPGIEHEPWLDDASSPLVVTDAVREGTYFVSAPGYAWRRVEIDHEHGGERIVHLERGGDVTVRVQNPPANRPAVLRARDEQGRCVRELAWSGGEPTLSRLPTGPLTLSLEYGTRTAPPGRRHTIATADVVVTAGGTARVVLDCDGTEAPSGPRRDLTGTLTAGPAWGDTFSQVLMLPLDRAPLCAELEATTSRRVKWPLGSAEPWRCPSLLPGRYRLVVTGFGLERDVTIPAEGPLPTVDLVAPEPVESEVVVLERGTNRRVHTTGVWLLHRGPDGVDRFLVRGRYVDGERTLLRSLPGDYRVRASAPRYIEADVTVRAGARHELFVDPACGTLLEFRCGNARLPIDPADVELTSDQPGARVLQCLDVGFQLSTHVSHAGRWRLRVQVPGYRVVDQVLEFDHDWRTTVVPMQRN